MDNYDEDNQETQQQQENEEQQNEGGNQEEGGNDQGEGGDQQDGGEPEERKSDKGDEHAGDNKEHHQEPVHEPVHEEPVTTIHHPVTTTNETEVHESKGIDSSWDTLAKSTVTQQESHETTHHAHADETHGTNASEAHHTKEEHKEHSHAEGHHGNEHAIEENTTKVVHHVEPHSTATEHHEKASEHHAETTEHHGKASEHHTETTTTTATEPDTIKIEHAPVNEHTTTSSTQKPVSGGVSPAKGLSAEDRYEQATKLKENGNSCIKDKRPDEAIIYYKNALMLINPNSFPEPPQGVLREKLNELRVSLNNNLSQSFLKMNQYDLALEHAEKVRVIDENNVKALYRIAVCLEKKGKDLDALARIKEALRIFSDRKEKPESAFVELYETLTAKTKEVVDKKKAEEKKDKENAQLMAQKMMGVKKPEEPKPSGSANLLLRGLLIVPSVGLAYLLLNKGLKSDLKSQNSKIAWSFLSATLFGTLASNKNWIRGVCGTAFFVLSGLAYKYKKSI